MVQNAPKKYFPNIIESCPCLFLPNAMIFACPIAALIFIRVAV